MREALMFGVNDVRVVESPKPQVGDGDVLIKVRDCGICPTDIRKYRTGDGGTLKLPFNLGHEYAGDVVEVGAKVTDYRPGMRVTGAWFIGYADYACVRAEHLSRVIELPANVSYEDATFVEPLADCIYCIEGCMHLKLGDKVAILGAGTMGVMKMMVAKAAGMQVMMSDPLEHRRVAAKEFGADAVVAPDELEAAVKDWTGGKGADGVIMSAGIPPAVNQAFTIAKNRGDIVLFGGFKRGSTAVIDPNLIHYKEVHVTGCYGVGVPPFHDVTYYHKAVTAIAAGLVPINRLITWRVPLEDIVHGLELMESLKGYKVIVNIS